jgi:pyruvate dehydrogenase E2 component (dihydrolipoamide acetyltransferase)
VTAVGRKTLSSPEIAEFRVPDLGENIEGGDVVRVLVAEGDEVRADTNVLELETEKAVLELPIPHAGRVVKVHVRAGDHVAVGDLVLTLEARDGAAEPAAREAVVEDVAPVCARGAPPAPAVEAGAIAEAPEASEPPAASDGPPLALPQRAATPVAPAGPATRRLARELGVDLDRVEGSGPAGRITREDVKSFVRQLASSRAPWPPAESAATPAPALPDFKRWGPVEVEPLKGIRKKTAEAMSLAWRTVPHVTQLDHADITDLEAARKRHEAARASGAKVTMTVLALKASVAALKAFPRFNSSLDPERGELITKRYYHIGVAVDTEHGLLVPVVRDADKKTLEELAVELADLAARARERRLDIEEMRGGTFTVTNLGGIGGAAFTPIVNWPEVAILGIARAREEVVLRDGEPVARIVLPLCLSYDHRVIDGADGARFLRFLAGILADPFALLLKS